MSKGLQFNLEQERVFAGAYAQRYLVHNRKTLLLITAGYSVWLWWMSHLQGTPIKGSLVLLSAGMCLAAIAAAFSTRWRQPRIHFPLFLGLFSLAMQALLIAVSLKHPVQGLPPYILFPILLPGVLFRLRFIFVLPFSLLLWVMQFLSVNFVVATDFVTYAQWALLTVLFMLGCLIVAFQLEQESRRVHMLLLNRPKKHVPAS